MRFRYSKFHSLFSICFAVWFVFLTASVHALHRHPRPVKRQTDQLARCAVDHHRVLLPNLTYRSSPPGAQQSPTHVGGLCPVCLFLAKNTAVRSSDGTDPVPSAQGQRRYVCGSTVAGSSLRISLTGPRAPPSSL
jgi:hypothetical protein